MILSSLGKSLPAHLFIIMTICKFLNHIVFFKEKGAPFDEPISTMQTPNFDIRFMNLQFNQIQFVEILIDLVHNSSYQLPLNIFPSLFVTCHAE